MSASTPSRRRGVRLTEEGVGRLESAFRATWLRDHKGKRLTWAAKAELLGMGVPTARRMFAGEAVDRSTLDLAFSRLGLAWDPAYDQDPPEDAGTPEPLPEPEVEVEGDGQAPVGDTTEAPASPPQRAEAPPRRFAPAFLALAVATCGGWTFRSVQAMVSERAWQVSFNDAFNEGQDRFNGSDYLGAHAPLRKALALAREHDSIGSLAAAKRLAGDLAGAEGRAREAKDLYREVLRLRDSLGQEITKPALYEAIGDAETTLGEYAEARKSLRLSLKGYHAMGDPTGVSMACRDLGSVAYLTRDLDGAEDWFRRSLYALEGHPKPDIAADVRGRRALVWLERDRKPEARAELRGCLDYWTRQGQARWIAASQLHLAEAEASLGHSAAASSLMAQSEEGYRHVGDEAGAAKAGRWRRPVASAESLRTRLP